MKIPAWADTKYHSLLCSLYSTFDGNNAIPAWCMAHHGLRAEVLDDGSDIIPFNITLRISHCNFKNTPWHLDPTHAGDINLGQS